MPNDRYDKLKFKVSTKTYTFNHLHFNDIEPEMLRLMLVEAFRRIDLLEEHLGIKYEQQ